MYYVDTPASSYSDPWASSLESRTIELKRGSPRVLYFYHQADNSTFRYRVYNMMQTINTMSLASASYISLSDREDAFSLVDACDVLVLCRLQYSIFVEQIVNRARKRGVEIVFDTDDFVFDTRYIPLIMSTLNQDISPSGPWDYWYSYVGRIADTARLCDRAILTNEYLAEKALNFGIKSVSVISNYMNAKQIDYSNRLYEHKVARRFESDGGINIGYFSGSPSHEKDFAIVSETLASMLDVDKRLRVDLVGYIPAGPGLERHSHRVRRHPFVDFVNLQKLISTVEINIAPLQDNTFTNSKSELKYFEAAVVGALTVASPTFTFRNAIEDGTTGFLAPAHRWSEKLWAAVDLASEGRSKGMIKAARADALARYSWYSQAKTVLSALFGQSCENLLKERESRLKSPRRISERVEPQ